MKFTFEMDIPVQDVERLRLYLTREMQEHNARTKMVATPLPVATNQEIENFLSIHVSNAIEHFLKEHVPPYASQKKQTRHKTD